ncbi:MAG: YegP family protein [Saprospiraceae bacterium]
MNIQDVTKLFDLEYFDGPLLSLFADAKGDFFLYKWYDLALSSHQWLVFKVKYATIQKYLNKTYSEYEVLNDQTPKTFYLIEFTEKGKPRLVKTIPQQTVSKEYEGLKSVFFNSEMCPNWKAVQHFFKKDKISRANMSGIGASPETPTSLNAKFIVTQENDNLYYFHLVDKSGRILMKSEAFENASNARKGVQSVRHLLIAKPKHKSQVKEVRKREQEA